MSKKLRSRRLRGLRSSARWVFSFQTCAQVPGSSRGVHWHWHCHSLAPAPSVARRGQATDSEKEKRCNPLACARGALKSAMPRVRPGQLAALSHLPLADWLTALGLPADLIIQLEAFGPKLG